MKSIKFRNLSLVSSWIIFFAAGKNLYSSILLMLAGAYAVMGVVYRIRKIYGEE